MRPEKLIQPDTSVVGLPQHDAALLTSLKGQKNLPRYFGRVLRIVQTLQFGSLILVLPDGRKFIAHGQSFAGLLNNDLPCAAQSVC